MPLTDTACNQAKPTGKVRRVFDGGGLYLEISPAGGNRFDAKEKRLSLGGYPDVGLKDARERRDVAPGSWRTASPPATTERG